MRALLALHACGHKRELRARRRGFCTECDCMFVQTVV